MIIPLYKNEVFYKWNKLNWDTKIDNSVCAIKHHQEAQKHIKIKDKTFEIKWSKNVKVKLKNNIELFKAIRTWKNDINCRV